MSDRAREKLRLKKMKKMQGQNLIDDINED